MGRIMVNMRRIYESVIETHFQHNQQMLFLAGPRQVGKTTASLYAEHFTDQFTYLNWDNEDHRGIILKGPLAVAELGGLHKIQHKMPIIVFDEIHKYRHWKNFIKGFFDSYKNKFRIVVTGSSKLDIYRTGGDSLMGRYFPYRIHPLTVGECLRTKISEQEINVQKSMPSELFNALFQWGGFPEPFLKKNKSFSQRWKRLRKEQLFRGDIRDLSHIQEIDQLEVLADLLKHQTGQLTNYTNLASKVKVSVDTVRRWSETLNVFYYCFKVKPYTKNITRSLLKEPKIYLWDWSDIEDIGARSENFIASHLLKAVHFWTDQGLGDYDLFFLRDKEKREVDFLVTKNNHPWFLVEVKHKDSTSISQQLAYFQQQTKALHAFQVVIEMDYVNKNCFEYHTPVIVPAKTFLSQLI